MLNIRNASLNQRNLGSRGTYNTLTDAVNVAWGSPISTLHSSVLAMLTILPRYSAPTWLQETISVITSGFFFVSAWLIFSPCYWLQSSATTSTAAPSPATSDLRQHEREELHIGYSCTESRLVWTSGEVNKKQSDKTYILGIARVQSPNKYVFWTLKPIIFFSSVALLSEATRRSTISLLIYLILNICVGWQPFC